MSMLIMMNLYISMVQDLQIFKNITDYGKSTGL